MLSLLHRAAARSLTSDQLTLTAAAALEIGHMTNEFINLKENLEETHDLTMKMTTALLEKLALAHRSSLHHLQASKTSTAAREALSMAELVTHIQIKVSAMASELHLLALVLCRRRTTRLQHS